MAGEDALVRGEGGRFAAQGGQADGCEVPLDAVAVEASVTAVGPADSGVPGPACIREVCCAASTG